MAVPEKNGIITCIFSSQKTYIVVDVFNQRHNSWLYVTCDNSRILVSITALIPCGLFPAPEDQMPDCSCPLLGNPRTPSQPFQQRWMENRHPGWALSPWPVRGCSTRCGCDGCDVCSCVGWDFGSSFS